jgi:hypothetical protein
MKLHSQQKQLYNGAIQVPMKDLSNNKLSLILISTGNILYLFNINIILWNHAS